MATLGDLGQLQIRKILRVVPWIATHDVFDAKTKDDLVELGRLHGIIVPPDEWTMEKIRAGEITEEQFFKQESKYYDPSTKRINPETRPKLLIKKLLSPGRKRSASQRAEKAAAKRADAEAAASAPPGGDEAELDAPDSMTEEGAGPAAAPASTSPKKSPEKRKKKSSRSKSAGKAPAALAVAGGETSPGPKAGKSPSKGQGSPAKSRGSPAKAPGAPAPAASAGTTARTTSSTKTSVSSSPSKTGSSPSKAGHGKPRADSPGNAVVRSRPSSPQKAGAPVAVVRAASSSSAGAAGPASALPSQKKASKQKGGRVAYLASAVRAQASPDGASSIGGAALMTAGAEALDDGDAYRRALLHHGTEREELAATLREHGLSLDDLGWEFRSEGAIKGPRHADSVAASERSGRASTERTDTAATLDSYGLSLEEIQTALVAGRSRPLMTP